MELTQEPHVGLRLRALRDQRRLSLRALAEQCGLSINAISQIERGESSPTVTSLHRLASALNVPITEFFQDDRKQSVIYVRRNRGLRTQNNGIAMESLGIGLTFQQLEPFRLWIEPGVGNVDDPIAHSGEEFVHCLDGEIDYVVGDRLYQLRQGDSLLFEAIQQHAYRNSSNQPALLLVVYLSSRDRQQVMQLHLE